MANIIDLIFCFIRNPLYTLELICMNDQNVIGAVAWSSVRIALNGSFVSKKTVQKLNDVAKNASFHYASKIDLQMSIFHQRISPPHLSIGCLVLHSFTLTPLS